MYAVQTYAEFREWIEDFGVDGPKAIPVLIVVGTRGAAKTTIVEEVLGDQARILRGHLTPLDLYRNCHEYLDRPIVIDDVDGLYADRHCVRLLKQLCCRAGAKTIAWNSTSAVLDKHGLPREFETKSRVVVIANQWHTLNENLGALEDRGVVLEFRPSPSEVHTYARVDDPEIHQFIGNHLGLIAEPSLRDYELAASRKSMGRDWRRFLWSRWATDPALVALLELLPAATTRGQLERVWMERMKASRATFHRMVQQLPGNFREQYEAVPKGSKHAKAKAAG